MTTYFGCKKYHNAAKITHYSHDCVGVSAGLANYEILQIRQFL